eukprot:TRINITY_DN62203_c0_g1_i1.p1 TRINITY_DN62203_c0_g1~~TRINITY_DN62203_c0_g1_i1.p1  ORF type:complete len:265 (+),score=14.87 TRINITY_DN62203_c0_g1_i1:63-857(+)
MTQMLARLQSFLDFDGAVTPHFAHPNGAGRHGLAGIFLGTTLGLHAGVLLLSRAANLSLGIVQWSAYVCLLCIFHIGEWFVTAAYRPSELAYKSWIINHSKAYTVATLASMLEFWLEYFLFPSMKGGALWIGMTCVFAAAVLAIRVGGMIHAGSNFDHIVMTNKKHGHELVTDGIYGYLRHPAYFGWFYWSIGGQLMLGNPVCTVMFALASHTFFSDRIPTEEYALLEIYKDEYRDYATRTPIGIPFVRCAVPYSRSAKSQRTD